MDTLYLSTGRKETLSRLKVNGRERMVHERGFVHEGVKEPFFRAC